MIRDLTGMVFSRLTPLFYVGEKFGKRQHYWLCECTCGNLGEYAEYDLKSGKTKSCGCFAREQSSLRMVKHGDYNSKEYRAWAALRNRCTNPNNVDFNRYGGRGITVCSRWKYYENFLSDMGRAPSPKHSIDRKDNNGNYKPSNCRWATLAQQNANRRNTISITIGNETKILSEWCRHFGVNRITAKYRLNQSWPIELVFSKPNQE